MRIYAGNLAHNVTEDDLRIDFECFGRVDSIELAKDEQGKFRGHAYIEMPDEQQAKRAIQEIDGRDIKGRDLEVHQAHQHGEQPKSTSKCGRSGYGSGT